MQHHFTIAIFWLCCCKVLVSAISDPTATDMAVLYNRRVSSILNGENTSKSNLNEWKSSLSSSGLWPDIDMTSGCEARRANWPATTHLRRTLIDQPNWILGALASAYIKASSDTEAFDKAMLALNYWFDNDYEQSDCVDHGGRSSGNCPCGTPGLWNMNWYPQVISVPQFIGEICMLLRANLTNSQKTSCHNIQERGYAKVNGMTGANLLDVSYVGITLGIFDEDASTTKSGLEKFYGGVVISPTVAGDGIQSDGSFMQHNGLLYNGNYGKDFINDLLYVFIMTRETGLTPDTGVQNAFETLMSGTEWMIMSDIKRNKLLWQYSTIGRMVSFKYSDHQASGGVAINIGQVAEGSEGWQNQQDIDKITNRLRKPSTNDANQGNLVGTRYFYNADYLVHRAPTYITTLKMYSSRTVNSECINTQNPYGFHLSDGALYNYLTGDEYVDVFGAWDWELVPGITVDYGGTPLMCGATKTKGKGKFVGAATDGNTGVAVMDFQNPQNGNLQFKKTIFFFPSGYAVQLGPVTSKNKSASLVTVLDQRLRNGDIYLNGRIKNTETSYNSKATSIWHDRIGYYFPSAELLSVNSKPKKSNWSDIGISKGSEEKQLWTSYINHTATTSTTDTTGLLTQYIVQPDIDASTFNQNVADGDIPIYLHFSADPQVNAAYSREDDSLAVAFWIAGTYTAPWKSVIITSDNPCVLLLRQTADNTYRLTVADPSQTLETIKMTVQIQGIKRTIIFDLPTGVRAGRYQVKTLHFSS